MCNLLCMNAQRPDWDDLEIFLHAAAAGSLTRAASQLNCSHATLSRRLDRLEERLKTRVLARTPQGCTLTAAGEALLEHVRNMEREVVAIERKVAGLDARLEGDVRLTTVDDVAVSVLPTLLDEFHQRHPRVCVHVNVGEPIADLARRESDVALRFGRRPQQPGLFARKLLDCAVFLYASSSYLGRNDVPNGPDDLAQHAIIAGADSMRALAMEDFVHKHAGDRVCLRSGSMMVRAAAIRMGQGIGCLPYFVARTHDDLVRLPVRGAEFSGALWLTMHADVRHAARVRSLATFLGERLAQLSHWFVPE